MPTVDKMTQCFLTAGTFNRDYCSPTRQAIIQCTIECRPQMPREASDACRKTDVSIDACAGFELRSKTTVSLRGPQYTYY